MMILRLKIKPTLRLSQILMPSTTKTFKIKPKNKRGKFRDFATRTIRRLRTCVLFSRGLTSNTLGKLIISKMTTDASSSKRLKPAKRLKLSTTLTWT